MIVAALTLSVLAFVAVLRLTGAVTVARTAAATARDAARGLRTPGLEDDAKEALSRRAAVELFGSFVRIAGIGVLALGLSFAVVGLGAAAGLYDLAAAVALAGGWPFIVGASAAATLAWVLFDRIARRFP
jgi:hypothetical protein